MNFEFTPDNAATLVTLLSPLLAIIASYLASSADMKSEIKMFIAFGVSVILAALTAYSQGKFVDNFWSNLFYIYTASQIVYAAAFKSLGLEKLFNPVEALASVAAHTARTQIAQMSKSTAQAVLDDSVPVTLNVSTSITDVSSDTSAWTSTSDTIAKETEDVHPA